MSDILVFSPPAPDSLPQAFENYKLGEICGWLVEEGYGFDQKSLLAEVRFLNRFRFQEDVVDLSVFEPETVIEYLQGGEDKRLEKEANKLADLLNIENYDTVVIPLEGDQIISIRDPRLFMALPILKERCRSDQTVIIGGKNLANGEELAGLEFVDYVVDGDMEIPLSNILEHEKKGQELESQTGLIYEEQGQICQGDPYVHPMDMKAKPYFNSEVLERYAEISAFDIPVIPYQLGRGCSQDCAFCTYFEDQSYQYKNVDKVVEELKEITQELGIKQVWFADQNLFNDPDYLKELAVEMQEEELDIKWAGLGMIVAREQEFFDILAESGLNAVYHGIESASNSVLHRMQKHQTRKMIESTLEKEYKAGIKPFAGFITDYVDETWDEYFETVDFIRQNPHLMGGEATALRIFPDERQPLYRNPEKFGIEIRKTEKGDWMNLDYDFNLPFKDSRGEIGGAENKHRKLKEKYLQRVINIDLFLKNFGRKDPLALLYMQLRKIIYKDYTDLTHEYLR